MITFTVSILYFTVLFNQIKGENDKADRFIIACHTTDFECFKRQYRSLRDTVLLGSLHFAIDYYKPYLFKYGDSGTCIKLTGLEESELVGISMDSDSKEYLLTLELPLRIQQVSNKTDICMKPDVAFINIEPHVGPYKSFDGNATIKATFPYELRKRKGDMYLLLKEEDLDVILDIPDLRPPVRSNENEGHNVEISEWAYEVVEHIDAAKYFALPYTTNIRQFTSTVPLHKYLLLYPEEKYADLKFAFYDSQ
ncbi:unnamed protein product [Parnassius apollo]|uniref:(apollo) hypothetical protein n=1 Tax=Parnassius apollo TaxID=110799 RepID=A0A8S3X7H9_PARAO|nr:unnamed protein product [Parnassius apollo]